MMSTEPGGLVETSDDGTLLPFIDLDRRRQGRLRKLVEVTFAFDVREHVLAGEGHFANVQVPENVNPLLASARGIPKTLSRIGKRPYSARSGACSDVLRRAAERLSAGDPDGDAVAACAARGHRRADSGHSRLLRRGAIADCVIHLAWRNLAAGARQFARQSAGTGAGVLRSRIQRGGADIGRHVGATVPVVGRGTDFRPRCGGDAGRGAQ